MGDMAEEEDSSWDAYATSALVDGGFCYAGGFADAENGPMYGASNWDDLYKEDHEVEELQDDGETTKKVMINEPANIKIAMDTGKKPPGGLWVGGVKYKIINKNTFEVGDGEMPGSAGSENKGWPLHAVQKWINNSGALR